jgi:hypothetical protein
MGFRELRPIAPIFGVPYSIYLLLLDEAAESSLSGGDEQARHDRWRPWRRRPHSG